MRVKIAVESLRPSDDLHDPSHMGARRIYDCGKKRWVYTAP